MGNIVLHCGDRRQQEARVLFPPMEPTHAGTDPEVRREIIETVRRFVAKEVIAGCRRVRARGRFPADIVAQMREWACSASRSPRSTAVSASTC